MMAEDFGALVNQQPKLSSRLDTKGETPKPTPKLSSRLDTKGETPSPTVS